MDMGERYAMVSKSIVKIYIGNSFFNGFVAECQSDLAFVIASSKNFPMPLKNFEVVLVFPDGKELLTELHNIEIVDQIAMIQCNFSDDGIDTDLVKALKICIEPLSMSEEIFTYSAHSIYEGVMTQGFVTELHKNFFLHNCSATSSSKHGALVVNKIGELVGLCYHFDRYLTSISVPAILEAYPNRN